MEEKPGWKTSEFWKNIGTQIGGIVVLLVVLLGGKPDDAQTIGAGITKGAVGLGDLVMMALTMASYIKSRATVKAAIAHATSPIAVQRAIYQLQSQQGK